MVPKRLLQITTILITAAMLSGCGSFMSFVEKMVDPYSRKYTCPNPEGFDCIDLDESYARDEAFQSDQTGATSISDQTADSAIDSETIEDLIAEDIQDSTPASLPDSQDPIAALLMDHIRDKKAFPKIESQLLEQMADNYQQCITEAKESASREHLSDEETTKALHACTRHLANVPGLTPYHSAALAESLKRQRQTEAKQAIAQSVAPGAMPIRVPAKQIRIFVAPYVDDNDILNQGHYLYTTIGEGRWVLPDHPPESPRQLNVLEK